MSKDLQILKIDLQLFGGRGASSGGREGGGGGIGMDDVLSTRELVSEREAQQEMVDETLGVFRDVYNDYGAQVEEIQLAELKPHVNAIAYWDGSNIAFNEKYFNREKLEKSYADCVKTGFHPSTGKKTALEAVAAHELGHKLTADAGIKIGGKNGTLTIDGAAALICNEARKQTKHRGVVQMERKISRYATHSNSEAIAEAFSDVYCNGKKAQKESIAIVGVLNKYLK